MIAGLAAVIVASATRAEERDNLPYTADPYYQEDVLVGPRIGGGSSSGGGGGVGDERAHSSAFLAARDAYARADANGAQDAARSPVVDELFRYRIIIRRTPADEELLDPLLRQPSSSNILNVNPSGGSSSSLDELNNELFKADYQIKTKRERIQGHRDCVHYFFVHTGGKETVNASDLVQRSRHVVETMKKEIAELERNKAELERRKAQLEGQGSVADAQGMDLGDD